MRVQWDWPFSLAGNVRHWNFTAIAMPLASSDSNRMALTGFPALKHGQREV